VGADDNHFIGDDNTRVPFRLARLDKLRFVETVVFLLHFGKHSLLDEFLPADAFLRLVVALVEHDPVVDEFLLGVADEEVLALIDQLNHVFLLNNFLFLFDD